MRAAEFRIELSPLDEARFGVRTAIASHVTTETLASTLDFCRGQRVSFLVARCLASELAAAQAMERAGFILTDTLVRYQLDVPRTPISAFTPTAAIRALRPGEEQAVRALASEAFRGYPSHYSADPRLDRRACDEVYESWAYRACTSREVADEVLVAERQGVIVGFAAIRLNSPDEAQTVLVATAPGAQRQGLRRQFLAHEVGWCLARGVRRLLAETRIQNSQWIAGWGRMGFEFAGAVYTFHKWFDER